MPEGAMSLRISDLSESSLRATKSSSGAQFSLAKQSAGVYPTGVLSRQIASREFCWRKSLCRQPLAMTHPHGGFSLMTSALHGLAEINL